ncbi:MAG: protein kinase [Planctomycetes bacterium]|nr:protein kinase [Planctomycetota bacterium]
MSRQVGHYVLGAEIARGGAGVVFRAVDARDGREVALKVMLDGDGGARRMLRFDREARALIRLRHPGIVSAYDTGVEGGRPWLAMELVQGESLQRHLDTRGPMAPAAAAELVRGLARAVEHAHQEGVLHRDLKPDNVLVTREGAPRLVDFGLARDLEPGEASRLTATGTVLGTPGYWAPEQARGERADVRTDVYGLGGLLHAALVGAPPIEADSFAEALIAVEAREVEPPSGRREGVDPALDAICLRALAKPREDRVPSAAALADALDAWLAGPRAAPPRRRALPGGGAARGGGGGGGAGSRQVAGRAWCAARTPPGQERSARTAPTPRPRGDQDGAVTHGRALAADPDDPAALAPRALSMALAGQRQAARDEADRAAAALPRDATTWVTIGRVRLLAGEPGATEDAAGHALERAPDLPAALALRAEARLALGRRAAAREDAERAVELAPDDPAPRLARALVRADAGALAAALDDVDAALRAAPDEPPGLGLRGDLRRRLGHLALARADLDRALDAAPGDVAAWRARALARAADGDPGALDDLERAAALSGRDDLALRARVRGLLGAWEAVREELEAAARLRQDPDELDALATCYLALRRPRDALAQLDRAARREPERAERWARLALHVARLGDPDRGRGLVERALAIDPDCALAACALAFVRYQSMDLEGALEALDQGLARTADATALELRAGLRRRAGDWRRAVEDFDRALAVGSLEPARAYFSRAACRNVAEPSEALADLDRALERDPRLLAALKARARLRAVRGDVAGATGDVLLALEEAPRDAELHHEHASLRRRAGDDEGALAAAARALELDPSRHAAHLTRALILLERDHLPGALDELDRAAASDSLDVTARASALRALVRRRLGDLDGALTDVAAALEGRPEEAMALTIRGLTRRDRGDAGGDLDVARGLELAAAEDEDLLRVLRREVDRR